MIESMQSRIWEMADRSDPAVERLAADLSVSPLLAAILLNRGFTQIEEMQQFLQPRLMHLLHPEGVKDLDKAVERILSAREKGQKVAVYGDYDVDGITATALLVTFLKKMDIPVTWYLPHRLREGYGLNEGAVQRLAESGVDLIVTVDCGISDAPAVRKARALGIDVIIVDHHLPGAIIPDARAVLNPRQEDCPFPYKEFAGVGIAFLLAVGLRSAMREKGHWNETTAPNLKEYLDLVALGTIADLAPLTGQNRILVSFGLEVLNRTERVGLKALKKVCGLDGKTVASWNVAFQLAPRINAGGRLGEAALALRLLTTDDPREALDLATRLDQINRERQDIENRILQQALQLLGDGFTDERRSIVLASPQWHRGVVGIVASRIVERFFRPTIVISVEDGVGYGSGRSISGFDLHGALEATSAHLISFGGHRYAAGIKIAPSGIDRFTEDFEAHARQELGAAILKPRLKIDAETVLEGLTLQKVKELASLEPFGMGNPEPLWMAREIMVEQTQRVGENHLRFTFGLRNGAVLQAIGFGMAEMEDRLPPCVDAVFSLYVDEWRGDAKIGIKVKDLRESMQ